MGLAVAYPLDLCKRAVKLIFSKTYLGASDWLNAHTAGHFRPQPPHLVWNLSLLWTTSFPVLAA